MAASMKSQKSLRLMRLSFRMVIEKMKSKTEEMNNLRKTRVMGLKLRYTSLYHMKVKLHKIMATIRRRYTIDAVVYKLAKVEIFCN